MLRSRFCHPPSRAAAAILGAIFALGSSGCGEKDVKALHRVKESGLPFSPAALIKASGEGRTTDVRDLLDAGVHPDAADAEGHTALGSAAAAGHGQVVRLLLDRKASVKTRSGSEPVLCAAARGGDEEALHALLAAGADPSAEGPDKRTPLEIAVAAGSVDAVTALAAASPRELRDRALMLAASAAQADAAAVLLENKADVYLRDSNGRTPMLLAAQAGDLASIKLFAAHGAVITAVDQDHHTALDLAKGSARTEAAAWFSDFRQISTAPCFGAEDEEAEGDAMPLAESDIGVADAAHPEAFFSIREIRPAQLPFVLDGFEGDAASVILPDTSTAAIGAGEAVGATGWTVASVRPPENSAGTDPGFSGGVIIIQRGDGFPQALIPGLPGIIAEPEALAAGPDGRLWRVRAGDRFVSSGAKWQVATVHAAGLRIVPMLE